MKILLIEPAKAPLTLGGEDVFLYEPLALEYLAAGVSRDHDVQILDMRLDKGLQPVLADFSPDVVGVTSYTVHVNTVRRLCEEVKQWDPRILTVVGGHHSTVAPGDFVSDWIDLMVLGEGVAVFQEIIARHERGEGFDGIQGIAFTRAGNLVKVPYQAAVDLDASPFPNRAATLAYRSRYFSEWMKPLASMRTSKGCPYRCNFCALWKLTGGRYLTRKPEKIVEELAGIDEKYIFFADDESLVDAARMKKLAKLISEAGIRKRYFLYGRTDTIARNRDLLEQWRDIGLERVFVGLEFFRDRDLESVGKGSTTKDNLEAVRVLQDLDIEIWASFIVRPDFAKADFTAFRQYCRDLKLVFAGFATLTPLPGTDFYEEVKDQLITQDYDLFDFIHTVLPTSLPLKVFYEEFYRLARNAIPPTRAATILRRFRARDVVPLLWKQARFHSRLRTAYRDYDSVQSMSS